MSTNKPNQFGSYPRYTRNQWAQFETDIQATNSRWDQVSHNRDTRDLLNTYHCRHQTEDAEFSFLFNNSSVSTKNVVASMYT
jgi:hypothetical protein